jgi:hypothetical protein
MNVPAKGYSGKSVLSLPKILIALLLMAFISPLAIKENAALAADGAPAVIGVGSYEELGEEYFGYYRLEDASDLYWFAERARIKPDICALIVSDIEINSSLTYYITIDPMTGKPIYSMEALSDFCKKTKVHIGIITVPAMHAQSACDALIEAGILAVWNFAPAHLDIPEHIIIKNENMASSFAVLSSNLAKKLNEEA